MGEREREREREEREREREREREGGERERERARGTTVKEDRVIAFLWRERENVERSEEALIKTKYMRAAVSRESLKTRPRRTCIQRQGTMVGPS